MKMLFCVLTMLVVVPSFAQVNHSIAPTLFDQIFDHPTCISSVQEEKVYIESSCIFPTEQGLFLQLDHGRKFISLQQLFSDEFGCYLRCPKERLEQVLRILNTCPDCGREYFVYCKNPDCPTNQKKKKK